MHFHMCRKFLDITLNSKSILAIVLGLTMLWPSHCAAQKRVALLIGNNSYGPELGRLTNAVNDAKSLGKALETLDFNVTVQLNRSQKEMKSDIDIITGDLEKGDMCWIFFAGHGQRLEGRNYLIPANTTVTKAQHLEDGCVNVEYLMEALKYSDASLRVAVLDCCRDNHIPSASRGSSKGMASFDGVPPDGSFTVFSTAPGKTASDGNGKNSPFTGNLIKTINADHPKGLEFVQLFSLTATAVKEEIGQRPYAHYDIALNDKFMLKKPKLVLKDAYLKKYEKTAGPLGMQLVRLPGDRFLMGSPENEPDRNGRDEFRHDVLIRKDFHISSTEITRGQWFSLMGSKPWQDSNSSDSEDEFTENLGLAAGAISWDAAVKFCQKLSQKEGKLFRLPTEAEWEYACRGGTQTAYSYGMAADTKSEYGWYRNEDGNSSKAPNMVGQKKPNLFGLYDMHGNVSEWCSDLYFRDYYKKSPLFSPTGPSDSEVGKLNKSNRVLRGGNYTSPIKLSRCARRFHASKNRGWPEFGFRVVLEIAESKDK